MGANLTRNRAWWHTAIWDEYGQRQQYLSLFICFFTMIPYYYHGAKINRDLEQNFAAKMYQLDYEQKRNRLTHNLIMEHFETHVEATQDLLDEVQQNGFEEIFKENIEEGIFSEIPLEKNGFADRNNWSSNKKAEYNEYIKKRHFIDHILMKPFSLNHRLFLYNMDPRRKYMLKPTTELDDIPLSRSKEPVHHIPFVPELKLSEEQQKTIRIAGQESQEDDEE